MLRLAGGVGTLLGSDIGLTADTRVLVVVYVHAVEDDVVLIAPRSHHFTIRRHTRLQAQQLNDVARVERQLPYRMLGEGIADRGVRGADGGSFRRDVDRLTRGPNFQLHVEGRRGVDLQHHVFLRCFREARLGDRQRVFARHHLENLILSAIVGNHLPRKPGGRAVQRNHRARNHGALRDPRSRRARNWWTLRVDHRDRGQQTQSRQQTSPRTPYKSPRQHVPLLQTES